MLVMVLLGMVLLGMVLARVVTPMHSWSQSSSVSAVSNSDQTRKGKVFCVWLFYFSGCMLSGFISRVCRKKTIQTAISLEFVSGFAYTARMYMAAFLSAVEVIAIKDGEAPGLSGYFVKGGPLMWPLLVLSVISLMVALVCLWKTRASAIIRERDVSTFEQSFKRGDYAGVTALCKRNASCFAAVMYVIAEYMKQNSSVANDEVREVASAEGARQSSRLTRLISWLSDIGAIAPMIGLLGTVVGMMKTFMEMAAGNFEGVKQMQMANGISEAMITTAGGLILAIPATAAYVFFRSRIQKAIAEMEVSVTHIVCSITSANMRQNDNRGTGASCKEKISRDDTPYFKK